ncbi:MAG: PolC-type DNA polymerase III, partial [Coriobacteriales bacterium]
MNLDDALIAGTDPDVRAAYAGYLERARTETFGLYEDDVVVLDTETTGFDPGRDEIIQIAAARMSGPRIVERFSTFVDPGRHIPDEISDLTGIDDQLVAGAPMADEALDELAEFCGSCDIVAHNVSFDRGFIMRDLSPERIPGDWIDTLALSQI